MKTEFAETTVNAESDSEDVIDWRDFVSETGEDRAETIDVLTKLLETENVETENGEQNSEEEGDTPQSHEKDEDLEFIDSFKANWGKTNDRPGNDFGPIKQELISN